METPLKGIACRRRMPTSSQLHLSQGDPARRNGKPFRAIYDTATDHYRHRHRPHRSSCSPGRPRSSLLRLHSVIMVHDNSMSFRGVNGTVHVQLMYRNHLTRGNRWGCLDHSSSSSLALSGSSASSTLITALTIRKVPNITETTMRCSPIRLDHWALHLRCHQDHAKDCPRKPI